MSLTRRSVLTAAGAAALAKMACSTAQEKPRTIEEFLRRMAWSKAVIDQFLDPDYPNWAMFDPLVGYRHHDAVMRDGIDGSYCIYRMEPTGERKRIHFANKPCRINTYGNSFTHCDQVNDGESWQEYLAAHFGEPVRNFGTGGYGVYQAYRRMLREEATAASAEYILFNVWIDDHRRSLMHSRWFHIAGFRERINPKGDTYFHSNPWAHVRLDPSTGALIEFENSHSTGESLYRMCDPDYMVDTFRDDLFVHVQFIMEGGRSEKMNEMRPLADSLGMQTDWSSPEAAAQSADQLFWVCGMKASEHIVQKALDFAKTNGKKLLLLLSYRGNDVSAACEDKPRVDQMFVDYLNAAGLSFVDGLQKHANDYRAFKCTPGEYVQRYYHGHYNPRGNQFYALAIKDDVLAMLDPKPVTYSAETPSVADIAAILAE